MFRSRYPDRPIIVTGHSLGAALSAFCALDLVDSGFDNVNHIDFGQPRIGNPVFAKYFAAKLPSSIRVVNRADIVSRILPQFAPLLVLFLFSRSLGFRHSPHELWFPSDGYKWKICNSRYIAPSIRIYCIFCLVFLFSHSIKWRGSRMQRSLLDMAMEPIRSSHLS